MKKPFGETQVGKLLSEKLPDAIKIIGNVLPDKGALGVLKNVISGSSLSDEDKALLLKETHDYEKEIFGIEQKDRESARAREIELAKAGGQDHLMYAAGYTALFSFIGIELGIFFLPTATTENPVFHQLVGIVESGAFMVLGYYFGASMRDKK
jgi:hypothetical protein